MQCLWVNSPDKKQGDLSNNNHKEYVIYFK